MVSVHVSITDNASNLIESGNAILASGNWIYTATTVVEANVIVTVVAADRPGGTTVKTVNKSL